MKSLLIALLYIGLTALSVWIWGNVAAFISFVILALFFLYVMADLLELD